MFCDVSQVQMRVSPAVLLSRERKQLKDPSILVFPIGKQSGWEFRLLCYYHGLFFVGTLVGVIGGSLAARLSITRIAGKKIPDL